MNTQHTNALIHESSPYLLQHAHNPVQWLPWGPEALQRAQAEDKVILVSIGYSACHWCHVMERESFEDEATAALMNAHFVNIKIDREERPDIDQIYMDAVQAMTGSGGWPLNVFLTPDGRPFYGGTYFPPVRAFNRASWKEVLEGVAEAWQTRRGEMEEQAARLTAHIGKNSFLTPPPPLHEPVPDHSSALTDALLQTADTVRGGFGGAPKFPQTFSIRLLMQAHAQTGRQDALNQALLSLDRMLQGGIYDQVGGGLARYSTDAEWLAPHFEKMLYDNALLVPALCDAWLLTGASHYREAVYGIIGFAGAELAHPEGGFYAALDADSEGVEGKYYVWTRQEVEQLLGSDADLFCRFYDITDEGNWEGHSILRILQPEDRFVEAHQLDAAAFRALRLRGLQQLKTAREARVRPGLDDKIILGWNALMVQALARAAVVFREPRFAEQARSAMQFLQRHLCPGGGAANWKHTWKNGQARVPAFLDDYALLTAACLQLYELDFNRDWLQQAGDLLRHTVAAFSDPENLFFYYTPAGQEDVILRKTEVYDGATPSGNSVTALNLLRLGILLDEPAWTARAARMTDHLQQALVRYPSSFGVWASLYLQLRRGTTELALVGPGASGMAHEILSKYYIDKTLLMVAETADPAWPLLRDRPGGDPALIYRCRNQVCEPPVADPVLLFGHPGRLSGD